VKKVYRKLHRTIYFLPKTLYNIRIMVNENVNTKVQTERLMVYLPRRSADALHKYMKEEFPPRARVKTAIVVKAINKFLEAEGYLSSDGNDGGDQ